MKNYQILLKKVKKNHLKAKPLVQKRNIYQSQLKKLKDQNYNFYENIFKKYVIKHLPDDYFFKYRDKNLFIYKKENPHPNQPQDPLVLIINVNSNPPNIIITPHVNISNKDWELEKLVILGKISNVLLKNKSLILEKVKKQEVFYTSKKDNIINKLIKAFKEFDQFHTNNKRLYISYIANTLLKNKIFSVNLPKSPIEFKSTVITQQDIKEIYLKPSKTSGLYNLGIKGEDGTLYIDSLKFSKNELEVVLQNHLNILALDPIFPEIYIKTISTLP